MHDDIAFSSALEQARLVRDREVSPGDLVDLYLARIERLNPMINAYITVAGDQARGAAPKATDGPFHGVPISIKDLSDTAGIRTTHGTRTWADRVPGADAPIVAKLKAAGFVVLGKTVAPEFGKSVVSEPDGYPPGRNPWNPERTCGGSSGGAAAALAAGLCPVSHGSDGGGSIRMPAACCGVVGIKASRGRISGAPKFPSMFGVQGPLTRTVADAAALLDVMSSPETGDWFAAPRPERPFLEETRREPGRLRIAFTSVPPKPDCTVEPANRQAAADAAKLLAELGHRVDEATPDWGDDPLTAHATLRAAELMRIENLPAPEDLGFTARMLFELGRNISAADYLGALDAVQRRNLGVVRFFDEYDVLVTPTLAISPPLVGEFAELTPDKLARFQSMAVFAGIWNDTGQPAFSLPLYEDPDGVPLGVQIVGRPNDEATLFRLAAQLEAALPWAERRPPVS